MFEPIVSSGSRTSRTSAFVQSMIQFEQYSWCDQDNYSNQQSCGTTFFQTLVLNSDF